MPPYLRSLGRLLNFSAMTCNQMGNSMLSQHDLSLAQWVILSALWREDGMLVSELAGYAGKNVPAASRVIDRMEKAGFVKRQMDKSDRRAVRVFLTQDAQKLSPLIDFYQDVNKRLTKGFTPKEEKLLFELLQRVIDNAQDISPNPGC